MKSSSFKNPNARLCLAVGFTVGLSQGLVRISSSLFGSTAGYFVNLAIVAALAFGFCSVVDFMMQSQRSSDAE